MSLLLLPYLAFLTTAAVLPPPPGPSNVTITSGPITDVTRLDPYAPTPTPRSLMLSILQPATCPCTVNEPYMPPLTASVNTQALGTSGWPSSLSFSDLTQPLCSYTDPSTIPAEDAPLVLFSPGLGGPRQLYNILCAAVASYGYTVVSMDHTYEAPVVEFPDGVNVYQNATAADLNNAEAHTPPRVQDVISVLNALEDPEVVAGLLPKRGAVPFETAKSAMFGHSLGGSTAANVLATDDRLQGGINLDGTIFGPVVNTGFSKPFVLFGAGNSAVDVDTWNKLWELMTGFKLQIDLLGSLHAAFSDAGVDAETLGVDPTVPPLSDVLGTVEGKRAIDVLSAYIVAFLDMVLKGKGEGLLAGPSVEYPDIQFIRSS